MRGQIIADFTMAQSIDPLEAMEEPKYFEDISTREKQIKTLARLKPHLIIVKENMEYAVMFKVNSKRMNLIINLPHDFPSEPPDYFIVPTLKHPWVNKKTNSVHPTATDLEFTNKKRLGKIVQSIIFEFKESYLRRLSLEQLVYSDDLNYIKIKSTTVPSVNGFTLRRLEETLKESRANQDLENATKDLITGIEMKAIDIMNVYEEAAVRANADVTHIRALKNEAMEKVAEWTGENKEEEFTALNDKYQKIAKLYNPEYIRSRLAIIVNEDDKDLNIVGRQFQFGLLPVEEFVQSINKYCLQKLGNIPRFHASGNEDGQGSSKASKNNKKCETSVESHKLLKVMEVDEETEVAELKVDANTTDEEKKMNKEAKQVNEKEEVKKSPEKEKVAKVVMDEKIPEKEKMQGENTAKGPVNEKKAEGGTGFKSRLEAKMEKIIREVKKSNIAKVGKGAEGVQKEAAEGAKSKKATEENEGKNEGGMKDGGKAKPKSFGK